MCVVYESRARGERNFVNINIIKRKKFINLPFSYEVEQKLEFYESNKLQTEIALKTIAIHRTQRNTNNIDIINYNFLISHLVVRFE